jgi:hypothetical protein
VADPGEYRQAARSVAHTSGLRNGARVAVLAKWSVERKIRFLDRASGLGPFETCLRSKFGATPAVYSPLIGLILHTVTGAGVSGEYQMREYSEYVACPCCGETMQLAQTRTHAQLPALETFECKPCGLAVASEAVSGSYALIEKRYFH